jgi:hypothetical protein
MSDPQKVTQQRALTTDSGREWLVVGAVITLLCVVMLWMMRGLPPLGAATIGVVTTVMLYLAMVAVYFGVTTRRIRLATLAFLTVSIVVGFAVVAWVIILSA